MNVHDRHFAGNAHDIAQVRYGDGEITILRPGRHVICAVSGVPVALEALRYWNATLQEAYAGPAEALTRWKELNGQGSRG